MERYIALCARNPNKKIIEKIMEPCSRKLKYIYGGKKDFLLQNQKNRGNKKIISKIGSRTASSYVNNGTAKVPILAEIGVHVQGPTSEIYN